MVLAPFHVLLLSGRPPCAEQESAEEQYDSPIHGDIEVVIGRET
jgi:hypothetical protein